MPSRTGDAGTVNALTQTLLVMRALLTTACTQRWAEQTGADAYAEDASDGESKPAVHAPPAPALRKR